MFVSCPASRPPCARWRPNCYVSWASLTRSCGLLKAHGPQSAARVLAKLIAVIAEGKEAELTESLLAALDQGAAAEPPPPRKNKIDIPQELAKHRVEPSSVPNLTSY